MESAPRRLSFAIAVLLASSACNIMPGSLPEARGKEVKVLVEGDLRALSPGDVVVEPVQLADGVHGVPVDGLRMAMQRALVRRRYSPLDLDYVDSRVVDASYPIGARGERAVCRVAIDRWDSSLWETHHAYRVDLTVSMINAEEPDGPLLWQAQLSGRIDVDDQEHRLNEPRLRQAALDEIALEILSLMPVRDTTPGSK